MIMKYLPWLIALLYVVSPYDVIPDFLAGPGWLDDLALLGLVFWWVSRYRRGYGPGTSTSSGTRQEQARETGPKPEEDPYTILGIQPDASTDEIKAAYKKLASQYHPDKVQHLGEEFQALAHEKFVAIQKAYQELTR